MNDDLLTRVRAAISDPKSVVGPRERGSHDDMYDAGETLANWQARAVLATIAKAAEYVPFVDSEGWSWIVSPTRSGRIVASPRSAADGMPDGWEPLFRRIPARQDGEA